MLEDTKKYVEELKMNETDKQLDETDETTVIVKQIKPQK